MLNFVVMGECMVEVAPESGDNLNQSFAGDVYNTAVYLKRLMAKKADVSILTAVGTDKLSDQMLNAFNEESINCRYVQRLDNKIPGLYLIEALPQGERSFTYWRNDSAAKYTLSAFSVKQQDKLIKHADIFYFSGISLAILPPAERSLFWKLLNKLKEEKVTIVFDTNYRPVLWRDNSLAVLEYEQAFRFADILFPGLEDLSLLFGIKELTAAQQYLSAFNIEEIVLKNSTESVLCTFKGQTFKVPVEKVESVVDTTSAGDSFNAGYMAARNLGHDCFSSAVIASKVAGEVIQHRGAIVESNQFSCFMEQRLTDLT